MRRNRIPFLNENEVGAGKKERKQKCIYMLDMLLPCVFLGGSVLSCCYTLSESRL